MLIQINNDIWPLIYLFRVAGTTAGPLGLSRIYVIRLVADPKKSVFFQNFY